MTFADVAVADEDVLSGAEAARVNQVALAAIGAFAAGLVAGAVRLTADYVGSREQFGKPLSTFQTVAAQLAEVYIASRTMTLASNAVTWGLSEGRDATTDLDILGYWITSQAPPGDADLPPPAWRDGHGHRLPDGPLLLHDQGPARDCSAVRHTASTWWEPDVHRTDPGAEAAAS